MSTASEEAAAFLAGSTSGERPLETRGATGEYARLRELVLADGDHTEDEAAEYDELIAKRRAGTLTGNPPRTIRKRPSVAGDRGDEYAAKAPKTASEIAAAQLRGGAL